LGAADSDGPTYQGDERDGAFGAGRGDVAAALALDVEAGFLTQLDRAAAAWEGDYFFCDEEGTRDTETWPSTLSDEVAACGVT
jgi:hypothetical protein